MASWSVVNSSLVNHHLGRIDAEYYKPESLDAYNYVKKGNYKLLGQIVKDGYRVVYENTKILKPEKVQKGKDVLFLQATNVNEDGLWIDTAEMGYVSEKDWEKYPKGRIRHGEVLIEVKGQAEKVTIVQDDMPLRTLVTGTLYKLLVDEKFLTPEYLFAYFSCKYGKILRDRTKVNTLISYVSKPELYDIPIPLFASEIEGITNKVRQSFKKSKEAHSLYQEAEELLSRELRIGEIELPKRKWYTASYHEVVDNVRIDSEYYQPQYKSLMAHLAKFTCKPLGTICDFTKGYEIGSKHYSEEGKLFLRVSNLSESGLQVGKSDKHLSDAYYSLLKPYQIKEGDLLCTKDGTIAVSVVVDDPVEAVFSSGIVRLTPKDDIPTEYIALVINSIFGKMQAGRDCSGALISHWKPDEMKQMQIPLASDEATRKIAELIRKSKKAARQSKKLLAEAKTRIETLIEQD